MMEERRSAEEDSSCLIEMVSISLGAGEIMVDRSLNVVNDVTAVEQTCGIVLISSISGVLELSKCEDTVEISLNTVSNVKVLKNERLHSK
jgi:hypothetical protein